LGKNPKREVKMENEEQVEIAPECVEYVEMSDEEFNNLECESYCDTVLNNIYNSLGM